MLKHFILYQGYVEDQSITCMTVSHEEGFETPEEAMDHFYTVLLQLAEDRVPKPKKCCSKTFDKNPKANFCMTCGFSKSQIESAEEYATTVWKELWTSDWDSLGHEAWETFQAAGWSWGWPEPGEPIVTCCRVERYFERWEGEPESYLISSVSTPG